MSNTETQLNPASSPDIKAQRSELITAKVPIRDGRTIDLFNLKEEDIRIEDIAFALSKECRFSNHTPCHYSVAEHSVYVALCAPGRYGAYFLLHDALEAYWRDMSAPFKKIIRQMWPDYDFYESKNEAVILRAFGLQPMVYKQLKEEIKKADMMMLELELDSLMYGKEMNWEGTPLQGRSGMGMSQEDAERFFLEAFYFYTT